MNRQDWAVGLALGITLIIVALSVFLVVIGSQWEEVSAPCYSAIECSRLSRTVFVPTPQAVIPLLLGMVVALGLAMKRMILAWSGTIPLLLFSLLFGFSIGLFYLPFDVALVGLLAIIQNQKRIL